jgi:hypothetical protein
MGTPSFPDPAMIVIGVLAADQAVVDKAQDLLQRVLGPIEKHAARLPFSWTNYYQVEMGAELTRSFLYTTSLVERQLLTEVKLFSNRVEEELAKDNKRTINLDPGLLSAENFILATTKNHAHRIFLRDGIFAELTLKYVGKNFEALDWTYPDYRSDQVRNVLKEIRQVYMQILRSPAKNVIEEVVF